MNLDINKNDVNKEKLFFQKERNFTQREKTAVGKFLLLSGFSVIFIPAKKGPINGQIVIEKRRYFAVMMLILKIILF